MSEYFGQKINCYVIHAKIMTLDKTGACCVYWWNMCWYSFLLCVLVISPRLPAGETERQLWSCKKKCFNLFRRSVQYELLRHHMSSETHGKFVLPEEPQGKNIWLCGLKGGIKKKTQQKWLYGYVSSLTINFIYC